MLIDFLIPFLKNNGEYRFLIITNQPIFIGFGVRQKIDEKRANVEKPGQLRYPVNHQIFMCLPVRALVNTTKDFTLN